MNREQTIRDAAYAIWEAEGRPTGQERQHWLQAEKQVAESAKPAAKKKDSVPKVKKTEVENATSKRAERTKKT